MMDTPLLPAFTHAPEVNRVYNVDAMTLLKAMPDQSVNCIVTSPPYFGLRSYMKNDLREIGKEQTPAEYVARLVGLFREARRVLRDDGVFFLNLGDSYGHGTSAGRKEGKRGIGANTQHAQDEVHRNGAAAKQLLGIPWRVVFGLQDDGWILRADIIWHKPNPMPESVTDRPTKAHEYMFLFAKSARYWYDADAIREPQVVSSQEEAVKRAGKYGSGYDKWEDRQGFRGMGGLGQNINFNDAGRNKRSVWTVATEPNSFAHFATFPTKLIEPCILAGCPVGGVVYDPFMGSGTTARVAFRWGRQFIGSEINADYIAIHDRLIKQVTPDMFATLEAVNQ